MRVIRLVPAVALLLAAAGCNQGNSDNVMARQANALTPEEVNAALGPELTDTAPASEPEISANAEENSEDSTNAVDNRPDAYEPDEPAMGNSGR